MSLTFLGYDGSAALFAFFSMRRLAKSGRGGGVGGTLKSRDILSSLERPMSPLSILQITVFLYSTLREVR